MWIGATASPHVRVGTITSTGSTITVTNSAGGINLETNGSMVGNTITGNSGGSLSPSSGNWNIVTGNSTIKFVGSGSTLTQDFSNTNLCLGTSLPSISGAVANVIIGGGSAGSGMSSGSDNTIVGYQAGAAATTMASSVLIGTGAGSASTGLSRSVAVGISSLLSYTAGVNANTTALGTESLLNLLTGTGNVAIGYQAGLNYTSTESNNILLGNTGTVGESNVTRIGSNQTKFFAAGVTGVTASNPVLTTINSSTGQFGVQALTQYDILVGGASNAVAFVGPGSSGQVLQSGGNAANPAYSTATYPSTATSSGKVLVADGTNWVASTPTFPNASATAGKVIVSDGTNWIASTPTFPNASASSGKFIRSDGTNWVASTPTLPTTAGSSGKVLVSDGTNFVSSTPTFPNASATSRKIIVSDGTNWVASTETYATPGSSGNVMTSNGTNWTSATPPTLAANALVSLNSTIVNVTGDNTFYGPIIFDTVAFDTGSNYNATTGLFTAPTTGKYLCCCSCSLQNLIVGHTSGEFRLEVAGSTYSRSSFNPYIMSASGIYTYTFSLVVPVTASQTLAFGAVVAGSTKTVGIQGNSFGNYSFASFTFLG